MSIPIAASSSSSSPSPSPFPSPSPAAIPTSAPTAPAPSPSSSPSPSSASSPAPAPAPAPSIRPAPRSPKPPAESFADLKWTWRRHLEPPNNLTKEQYEQMVLRSGHVEAAIDSIRGQVSREEATAQAKAIFDGMYANINEKNVRASLYVMRKVWRQMYEGIRVNQDGIEMIRKLSAQRIPVVLLPMHKSHIDYLLLSYVCASHHLYPPHIVAGDNLNMPIVGSILKHGGGLFIRRQFGSDVLYKAVFHQYICCLLKNGHTLEAFIEGARSRSGKLKSPKTGFLSVLADCLANGDVQDIMLVPIAISYDKVIEGSTYVNEMLGAKKQKESLTSTINSINHVVRLNFGSIDVSICKAISLRSLMPSPPSALRSLSHADHRRLILSIAHTCMYQMNLRLVITATAIVAACLLASLNRGMPRKQLIERVEWLKNQVILRGGIVAHIFNIESLPAIVDRALKALSKLIQEQHGIIYGFRNVTSLELCFYRNQLLHFFISESLVVVAMAAEYKDVTHNTLQRNPLSKSRTDGAGTKNAVDKTKLVDSVRFISQLLKFEFIYKQAPELEDNVDITIDALLARGVLLPSANDPNQLCIDPHGIDTFMFLCMLAWPFVEVYWIAIASLFALQPDIIMEQGRLAEMASSRAEALYYSGGIDFYEALSTEAILNAYEWCISQGILRVHTIQAPTTPLKIQKAGAKMLQLTPEYQHMDEPTTSEPAATSTQPPPVQQPHNTNSAHAAATSNANSASTSVLSANPTSASSPLPSMSSVARSPLSALSSVLPSLTRKDTRLSTVRSGPPASGSSSSSELPGVGQKSLRELITRVGRFRKSRTQQGSVLDGFIQGLGTGDTVTPTLLSFLRSKI